jgi:stage II sporulation protein D
LSVTRRAGWSTVPSNDFVATRHGDQVLLEGTGLGHGIGLCETGAKSMAKDGATFREILNHYYPNTTVLNWSAAAPVNHPHAESSSVGAN